MRVFVNYAESDQPLATELGNKLQGVGYQVWIDTPQAGSTQLWEADVAHNVLEQSIVLLNVVSHEALQADHCRDNLNHATILGKPVIHLLRDNLTPTRFQDAPTIDVSTGLTSPALARLLELVNEINKLHQLAETPSTDPVALNDLPTGADELGFQDYAGAFAEMITHPNAQPPLTIGIYGPWGTGKTFLMHKIGEEVERIQAAYGRQRERRRRETTPIPAKTLLIEFDAWAYNASELLWAGLVQKIFQTIEDQLGSIARIRWTLARNLQREGRQLLRQIVYLILFVVALTIPLYLVLRQLEFNELADLVPFLSLPVLVRATRDLTQLLATPQSRQIASMIATTHQAARQRQLIQSALQDRDRTILARVHEDMAKMLQALPRDTRMVVFIDDLDRCNPERVVDVLEAINLLLAFKEFIVFLAIDTRVVASIIEASYGDTLRRAGISGYEYLDKIVQLPFTIPKPRQRDILNYLNTLIEAPAGETDITATFVKPPAVPPVPPKDGDTGVSTAKPRLSLSLTDLEIAEAHHQTDEDIITPQIVAFTQPERGAFRAFSAFMNSSPRNIKRLVNVYRLVRTLARRQGATIVADTPAKMILWLLLCQEWPYATANLLDTLRRAGTPTITLEALYAQVADRLDNDVTGRHKMLDYDNFVLDDLIAQYGKHITGSDIHAMQALTLNFHPALMAEYRAFLD